FGGLLADRLPRRQLLIATQSALGVLAAGLGVLVLGGHAELWHVYVFALLLGIVTALDNPVRQTFVAEMVPPASLPNAVGLNSASFNAARLIGPGVSGLLIAVVGPGWIFIINALSFAATILSLTFMRKDELHELPHTSRGKGQIRDGLAYVRGRSDIVTIMVVVGVVGALGLNFQMTSALMVREVFQREAGEYGILGSIMAIGSLGGALLAARRRQPRVRLVLGAAFAFGVASGLMALMPTYELYALMTIPVGLTSLTMMTAANATVQMSTDPHYRGRVMSLYMMVFLGTTPIGAPIVGWIGETFSARRAVVIRAVAAMVVSVAAALWVKRHCEVEVTYRLRHRPHVRMIGPGERARSSEEAKARLGASDAENATGLA